MAKGSKFAAKLTELVGIREKMGSEKNGFFQKRNPNFWKQLSLANLMSTATETVSQFDVECERNSEVSQNVQNLGFFLLKKMGFPNETLKFSKIADGNNFAVHSGGLSKVSQNVQIMGFGSFKENFGFSRKTEVF